jgi:DNA-binding NarL/FixJ family response regulator
MRTRAGIVQNVPVRPSLLLVDDHAGFREFARLLLEADGFDVVGSAGSGEVAITEAIRLRPDLVLLDVHLPGIDGFVTAERLAALDHPPAVVLISSRDARSFGPRIADAPVRGFLTKQELSGASLTCLIG